MRSMTPAGMLNVDTGLEEIARKVEAGERLTLADGRMLF